MRFPKLKVRVWVDYDSPRRVFRRWAFRRISRYFEVEIGEWSRALQEHVTKQGQLDLERAQREHRAPKRTPEQALELAESYVRADRKAREALMPGAASAD